MRTTVSLPSFPDGPGKDAPFQNRTSDEIWAIYNSLVKERYDLVEYKKRLEEQGNSFKREVVAHYKDTGSQKGQLDSGDTFLYFVTLMSHTDASLLQEIFEKVTPISQEIIVLLENNETDLFTSAKFFVKIGADVAQTVKENNSNINGGLILERIKSNHEVNIDFETLQIIFNAREGIYSEPTVVEYIVEFGTALLSFNAENQKLILQGFEKVQGWLDALRIKEAAWNPEKAEGEEFVPKFFPDLSLSKSDSSDPIKIPKEFEDALQTVLSELEVQLRPVQKNIGFDPIGLDNVRLELKQTFDKVKEVLHLLLKGLGQLSTDIVVFVNAVLCGFINSIIDLIKFVVDIISLPYKATEFTANVLSSAEAIDELLQKLMAFDFGEFFSTIGAFFEKVWDKILSINIWELIKSTTPAKAGYFVGGLLEFIAEILLEILFTGGVAAVASAIGRVMRGAEKVAETIAKIVRNALKLAAKVAVNASEMFLKIMALGAKGFRKMLDDIWEVMSKWVDDIITLVKKVDFKNYREYKKTFGAFIKRGKSSYRKKFLEGLRELPNSVRQRQFLKDARKMFNSKKRKITFEEYVRRGSMRILNIEKGQLAEKLFQQIHKGVKAAKAIKTKFTRRFVDNIERTSFREIKSGFISNSTSFQTQLKKDVDILKRELHGVSKYEWHCLEGIDEEALKFAKNLAEQEGVLEKLTFVIY